MGEIVGREELTDSQRQREAARIRINEKIKIYQGQIKMFRSLIDDLKREKDFLNGHYDKTWEEEYVLSEKAE